MPILSDLARILMLTAAGEGTDFLARRRDQNTLQKAIEGVSQAPSKTAQNLNPLTGLGIGASQPGQFNGPFEFRHFPLETFQVPATSDFATDLINAPAEAQQALLEQARGVVANQFQAQGKKTNIGINLSNVLQALSGNLDITAEQLQQSQATLTGLETEKKEEALEPGREKRAKEKEALKQIVGGGTIDRGGLGDIRKTRLPISPNTAKALQKEIRNIAPQMFIQSADEAGNVIFIPNEEAQQIINEATNILETTRINFKNAALKAIEQLGSTTGSENRKQILEQRLKEIESGKTESEQPPAELIPLPEITPVPEVGIFKAIPISEKDRIQRKIKVWLKQKRTVEEIKEAITKQGVDPDQFTY